MFSITSHGKRRALSCSMRRRFGLTLVLTFCIMPLQSATLERLSLADMIAKSTAIVRGTVIGSSVALQGPIVYTHYSIRVTERLKGHPPTTVDVVVPGGVVDNVRQSFPGTPQLNPGDDFVFFLWSGRSGVIQILGLTQGLFAISGGGSRKLIATRSASREVMLDPGTGQQVKDQTLVMNLSDLRSEIAAAVNGSSN